MSVLVRATPVPTYSPLSLLSTPPDSISMMSADDEREIINLEDKTGQGVFPSVQVGCRMEDQGAEEEAAAAPDGVYPFCPLSYFMVNLTGGVQWMIW